ncbi:DegT/DnrJ/EryC1/StrS family aminotransferase [Occallatibacter riparius]|uniref:DegT/DnrJ/EryC1/StrS family aminotransferase n=1 Tax=Occallatibacter riparius TaxID=1002689 RepID=A0A9J7BM32_9BACT|nr:DegT/DnrJ/EryC1/StrS family aminotransferase [Occallatibacter riparius]UWZ83723.1 DegT/DnrJ/EryC1/StrS family aminotransferase [Occallatibacter riparius]
MNREIPFLDLVTPHRELQEEFVEVLRKALNSAAFIGGTELEAFEREFATFTGATNCVGVANGTDALRFALMALGVQAGDAVITVANTFIATAEAISQSGARPYFVDIDERTYNMSAAKVREFITTKCHRDASGNVVTSDLGLRVKAVIPVHLYGQMADMDPILAVAEEFGLLVVEDACQAHGAEYFSVKQNAWLRAGSIGHAAAFSFYPGKNLGACGEAGAVTTNSEDVARKIRIIRDHGQAQKYYHDVEGYNGRLDAIQAGFLRVKLRNLAQGNLQRRAAAKRYNELLAETNADVVLPFELVHSKAVYHLYVIRVRNRDEFRERMAEAKVGTAIHYPVPLHLQKAYKHLGYSVGDFPITEAVSAEIVSLPMFPHITEAQIRAVVNHAASVLEGSAAVETLQPVAVS